MIASRRLGARTGLVIMIVSAGVVAYWILGLSLADLWPKPERLAAARDFLGAAFSPALDYEAAADLPAGAPDFLVRLLLAVWRTLAFALAAWSLALMFAIPLGFLASGSFWNRHDDVSKRYEMRGVGRVIYTSTRALIVGLRSVHELLWAVLLLAALGLSPGTGVLALALPFTGTLAKVFSELLDESASSSAVALRATGARPLQVFAFGVVPRALPDMLAFSFYRLECSVRASAVLGFFGFETLGYYLRLSFENLHYREVWTFLYALIVLVIVLDAWSARLRRRFVA